MNQDKENTFKDLLLDEKQRILNTLGQMKDHWPGDASIKEYSEELSAYDNHPADIGTELFMATMQMKLENREKFRLNQIEDALHKIEMGGYGICQKCGNEISEERLRVIPEVLTCIKCEELEVPLYETDVNRPIEEKLLSPPFARTDKDDEDYTGFDGEDAYQEVARYNRIPNDPSNKTADDLDIFDEHYSGIVEGLDKISRDKHTE